MIKKELHTVTVPMGDYLEMEAAMELKETLTTKMKLHFEFLKTHAIVFKEVDFSKPPVDVAVMVNRTGGGETEIVFKYAEETSETPIDK